jgi:hypothetical protein
MIIMLFMAITSTGSAECIAVSSLWSYDVYRRYINPNATGKQILMHSRIWVCIWALCMACFSLILNEIGVSLGWVYNFMGIMIGSAVFPIACVVTWARMPAMAAICGAWGGMILAVITWLCIAGTQGGSIDIATTGLLYAQLGGNCVAIGASIVISVLISCLMPQNYDWSKMNEGIKLVGGDGGENAKVLGADWESSPEFLLSAKAWILKYGVVWTVWLTFGWPLLAVPWAKFNTSIYSLWASVALCWGYLAGFTIILLPIIENMHTIVRVFTCKPMTAEEKAAGKMMPSATQETATA